MSGGMEHAGKDLDKYMEHEANEQVKSLGNSKIPSYVPIYDRLYTDIMDGVYESGTKLPGEATLAAKYNVSRNTLRQALTVLVEDGLVAKMQGKGTFVTFDKNRKQKNCGMYNPIIFIEEIFYNKEKEAISRGKFYFLPEEYDIVFQNRDL